MALAIVQTSSGSQASGTAVPGQPTVSSTPTVGNLLIVFLHTDSASTGVTPNTSSYTQIASSITTATYSTNTYALIRYVQNGDTTTLPAMATAGSCHWAYVVYEISGVTGDRNKDFQIYSGSYSFENNFIYPLSLSQVPQTSNTLAICSGSNYTDNATISVPSGWTSDVNTGSQTNWGSLSAIHYTNPVSGTAISGGATHMASGVQLILQASVPAYPYVRSVYTNAVFTRALNEQETIQAPPTPGNLIIALIQPSTAPANLTPGSGWTRFDNYDNGGIRYADALYRYAIGGDTATLTGFYTSSGTNTRGFQVYEIAGVKGTWSSDFQHSNSSAATATSLATTTDTTLAANTLVLVGVSQNLGGGSATAPTVSANWIIDNYKSTGESFSSSRTFASASSSVTNTIGVPSSTSIIYTQSLFGALILSSAITEAGTATDTDSVIIKYILSISEAGSAADSVKSPGRITEFGNAVDTVSVIAKISVTVGETASAVDIVSQNYRISLSISESGSASDGTVNRSVLTNSGSNQNKAQVGIIG